MDKITLVQQSSKQLVLQAQQETQSLRTQADGHSKEVHDLVNINIQLKQTMSQLEEKYKVVAEKEAKRSMECETLITQIGKLNDQVMENTTKYTSQKSQITAVLKSSNEMAGRVMEALQTVRSNFSQLEERGVFQHSYSDIEWITGNVKGGVNFALSKMDEFIHLIEQRVGNGEGNDS